MRSYSFFALVKCKDIYEYVVKKGSLELYVDPLYKQGARKVTSGTVLVSPETMPDYALMSNPLRSGDKVYFHYNSLDESSLIPDSDNVFMIPMDMIFAYVRDGQLYAMDGKVLCRPYYDDDIVEIIHEGNPMKVKMSKSGIITELNVKHSLKRAIVAYVGPPLRGFKAQDVSAGDHVFYATDADFENVIEGETFFVMDQDLLLYKL